MNRLNAESPDESWRKTKSVFGRASGHWRLPLNGYGLAYLDRLLEEFASCWPAPLERAAEEERDHLETRVNQGEEALHAAERLIRESEEALIAATQELATAIGGPDENTAKAKLAEAEARLVTAKSEFERRQDILKRALRTASEARFSIGRKLEAAARIRELAQRRDALVWSDLLVVEAALGRLRSPIEIRSQLPLVRSEYRELIGPTAYAELNLSSVNLSSQQIPETELRAEFEALLSELHWHYLSSPQAESTRSKLLCGVFLSLALLVLTAVAMGGFGCGLESSPLAMVAICGGLGATLSAVQRTQSVKVRGGSLVNLRGAVMYWLSYSIAPWVGALCAMILAMTFAAAFLSGSDGIVTAKAFPEVRWARNPFATNLFSAATNIHPNVFTVTNTQAGVNKMGGSVIISNPVLFTNYSTNVTFTNASHSCSCTNCAISKPSARKCPDGNCSHPPGGEYWSFKTDRDYALLLIWALIAGFSERLVPDLLSRVSRKAEGVS